jgi:tripartite-type tricarboxylate transporter receptor subunit TctC
MMVSYIQSNFSGFGSGVVVPGTGISLQNRGSGFSVKPDHANVVAPRKRPFHTIIPGFVTRNGQPLMSFGVMGGSMQAQGHMQVMSRLVDYKQNPQAAADAPRWRIDSGLKAGVEYGMAPDVLDALRARGHELQQADRWSTDFGRAQLIYKLDDGYCGGLRAAHGRPGSGLLIFFIMNSEIRRLKLQQGFASAFLLLSCAAHAAQPAASTGNYPQRPIRVIVPFAAGGGLDITARLIGQRITEKWGQNFVIDTRPGAATIVGTEIAARALPDGYTILMITTTFAINPSLYKKLPYDPFKDFTAITQLNSQPNIVVVNPTFAASSVKELIALAKTKQGGLTFASPGAGSAPHLSGELFQRMAGLQMVHVPYKGIPPAVTDVLGGRVSMLFTTTISAAPHLKSGKLKALALTSAKRLPNMPDVPTIGETVPGYQAEAFQGVVAPAGVPRPIIDKLAAEIIAIVRSREIAERFDADGAIPVASSPQQFSGFLKSEMLKWGKVIKEAGIQLEQ